jgi:quercetin dioxygenase-like cupin family protein
MTRKIMFCCALVALGVLIGRVTAAQAPRALMEEQEVLNNSSVRIALITYQPGADSDLHLNLGPEITIMQEGELALYADAGREALQPPAAHWLPESTVHLARNEGKGPARFWSILLKRCD